MFILIGLFFVILAITLVIVAGVYGVLVNRRIKNQLSGSDDSNLSTANKYSLAAYILIWIALLFMFLIFFAGTWKYRRNLNSEDEIELGYSHVFGAILALLTLACLIAAPILILVARNNYLQFTMNDVSTLNYFDYCWFLATAALIMASCAFAMIAIRLNYHNSVIDCAMESWSNCRDKFRPRCRMNGMGMGMNAGIGMQM